MEMDKIKAELEQLYEQRYSNVEKMIDFCKQISMIIRNNTYLNLPSF